MLDLSRNFLFSKSSRGGWTSPEISYLVYPVNPQGGGVLDISRKKIAYLGENHPQISKFAFPPWTAKIQGGQKVAQVGGPCFGKRGGGSVIAQK